MNYFMKGTWHQKFYSLEFGFFYSREDLATAIQNTETKPNKLIVGETPNDDNCIVILSQVSFKINSNSNTF